MAGGDSIRIEKDTPEKLEVFAIAAKTGLDTEIVFTKCFKLWRWADTNTVDGVIRFGTVELTIDHLDSFLFHSTGFSRALLDAGWLQVRSGSLVIPNFARHMGQAARERLDAADRQRRSRARRVTDLSQDVTELSRLIPRPMRREVYLRDEQTCVYCGFAAGDSAPVGEYVGATISLDHVLPFTRGGQAIPENLVTSCTVCNRRKNNRTPEEAGMVAKFVTENCDKIVTQLLPRSPPAPLSNTSSESKRSKKKEKKEREAKKPFVKPSVVEVADYVREIGGHISAQRFVDHYESNGWRVGGKGPMKDWRASVRNWESNERERPGGHGQRVGPNNSRLDAPPDQLAAANRKVIRATAVTPQAGGGASSPPGTDSQRGPDP